jgi:ComF family protein
MKIWGKMTRAVLDAGVGLLYPTACRVCGQMIESWEDGVACDACWREVRLPDPACSKCGFGMRTLPSIMEIEARRCGRCEAFAFDRARACGLYEGALRESILFLKSTPHLASRLRRLLRSAFENFPAKEAFTSIIPIPLHPSRLTERTFNQAAMIAGALAIETGLKVDAVSLIRIKPSEMHRAGMGAAERARSMDRSFEVRAPRLIKNRALLVVDDMMTTGSTAHEVARTLIDAEAQRVSVLTLARAANDLIS